MKAIVYERYGAPDVLELREVPKPAPKSDEVLIAIRATTVSSADWRVRSLAMPKGFGGMARLIFGIRKPRQPILGAELAGVVESIGSAVTRFQPGDEVFALTARMGCHAQYRCLRQTAAIAHKPRELSFEQAAALAFGGSTALEFFRRANLQRGERVLVNGAAGCVGSAAVQIAKHFGAHVTAVCSAANFELVKSIGADAVIDYARTDFTQTGETYDVILDSAGSAPFSRCKGALTERGRLLLVLASLPAMLEAPLAALTSHKRVIAGPAVERADTLQELAKLAEVGAYKPVIDRCFAFEQIADAHALVDSGHKRGSVVVTVA